MDIAQFIPESQIVCVSMAALAALVVGVLLGRQLPGKSTGIRLLRRGSTKTDKDGTFDIYIGNLAFDVRENDLTRAFERFGRVASVRIIKHKLSGKSKGFGFVSMTDRSSSLEAIRNMDGMELKGRPLVVHEAKSRPWR